MRAFTVRLDEKGGVTTTYTVESAAPHRLLEWRSGNGESGTIVGSARLPYWQLNAPGGERHLKEIGLRPLQPARVPQ